MLTFRNPTVTTWRHRLPGSAIFPPLPESCSAIASIREPIIIATIKQANTKPNGIGSSSVMSALEWGDDKVKKTDDECMARNTE